MTFHRPVFFCDASHPISVMLYSPLFFDQSSITSASVFDESWPFTCGFMALHFSIMAVPSGVVFAMSALMAASFGSLLSADALLAGAGPAFSLQPPANTIIETMQILRTSQIVFFIFRSPCPAQATGIRKAWPLIAGQHDPDIPNISAGGSRNHEPA